jgi:hypothetical protein
VGSASWPPVGRIRCPPDSCVPMTSKELLFALLQDALRDVRLMTAGSGPLGEESRREVWALAYATHNWPAGLRDAMTNEDFDRFLVESWHRCPPPARHWMEQALIRHGQDPRRLDTSPDITTTSTE